MSDAPGVLEPEAVLITPTLYERVARPDDLQAELAAYHELSSLMTLDPVQAIQRFLDLAVELCPSAGSAGLSEMSEDEDGKPIFRWTAMSGAFAPYVGGTTPRHFSPCGLCLDQHHTILVERPARVFTYFNEAEPAIVEGLIVPLYDTGKRPLGTVWVVSHEDGAGFDGTDARIMEQLAIQLVLALKLRRKASIMVKLEEVVRDKDVLVEEVRHRVKNMIQMTSGLLQLQERGVTSTEARTALREAQSRLLVLASVYEALLLPKADAGEVGCRGAHRQPDGGAAEQQRPRAPRRGANRLLQDDRQRQQGGPDWPHRQRSRHQFAEARLHRGSRGRSEGPASKGRRRLHPDDHGRWLRLRGADPGGEPGDAAHVEPGAAVAGFAGDRRRQRDDGEAGVDLP